MISRRALALVASVQIVLIALLLRPGHGESALAVLAGAALVLGAGVAHGLAREAAERAGDRALSREALARGIQEVQATQDLLRRSEEYYRSLVEHGSDIVVVLRADGRIRYASPSVERSLGYEADALRHRAFLDFVEAADVALALESFGGILDEPGGLVHLTLRIRHVDGSERHLEGVAHNLVHTSVAGVVYTARDITDRVRVEEALRAQEAQLRQAQKMEAVGRLAGGVAHDFNNILTVMGGHGDYLLEKLAPGDPLREEAVGINDAVARAGRLTRQLLVFSRREVARARVVDLGALVRDVDTLIRRLVPATVTLRTELQAERWRIVADPGHIEQVILNLVVNARDAMAAEGTLTIATADREVVEPIPGRFGDVPTGQYVRLTVSDTGAGIAPEIIDRIFDPFFTTKGTGGTGLGLSTVFGIARDAGAGIRVESEVGHGARFEFYFPATEDAVPAFDVASPQPAESAGETLLLVEDEEALRTLTARGLRERGYTVLSAANAEAALRMVDLYREPIDLLVTDVVMPGLNGPALHRELEARAGRVPALFVSGYPGEDLGEGVLEGLSLLPKPFTAAQLGERIRRVLDEG